MKPFLTFLALICLIAQLEAQQFRASINRLGLGADATFLQLDSDAINSSSKIGFAGYLETRGDFSRSFDVIYSIGIFNHHIELEEFATNQTIDASMLGAEVKFLFAYRPFRSEYLTIEAGPAVMLNGEWNYDDEDNLSLLGSQTPIILEEFEKTNPINLNGVVGISVGTNTIRATAHYHYSFFDALDGVDTLGNELDGKLSYLSAGLRVYF